MTGCVTSSALWISSPTLNEAAPTAAVCEASPVLRARSTPISRRNGCRTSVVSRRLRA